MLNIPDLINLRAGAVVAPAGHGKTEVIAAMAGLSKQTLVLTHTHAGVHAIRDRIKKRAVAGASVTVDTIAGWCMTYAHAFPKAARPCEGMPKSSAEWDQLYRGVISVLQIGAVQEVIKASYDRVLIDEYQDCHLLQHELAVALSALVPSLVFGDPMQGIFEFAGATLDWPSQIHPLFPNQGTLDTPHRWAGKNEELGKWIADTRERLELGLQIDLLDAPIQLTKVRDAFDMGALFDGVDEKEGLHAAIHCNKSMCYKIARASKGGYQAIEEIAASRLQAFAEQWDESNILSHRVQAFALFLSECAHVAGQLHGQVMPPDDVELQMRMLQLQGQLIGPHSAASLLALITLAKKRSDIKLFRKEIWRDAGRAAQEIIAGRVTTMVEAVALVKKSAARTGRSLPRRTISTPLLLKGLEFDHVVIPDATHFLNERVASAKLFYVAISRATRSLNIASSARYLHFPIP
jgi:DNA helicase-2/ATP-dependent DNA helicase PcrA